jgi:diguanylate cyclase (GGDEF)-like protein
MFTVIDCLTQEHDWRLLIVAIVICGIAAVTSLNLLARAAIAAGRTRQAWTAAGAIAFGCGIWATHFVAMLGFHADQLEGFAPGATVLSGLVAVAGMLLAFGAAQLGGSALPARIGGGAIAGGTIGAMHYLGLTALRVPGTLLWDRGMVLASFAVGVPLAVAAFLLFNRLARWPQRLIAAALLALAICGLHFTGVAALIFLPDGGPGYGVAEFNPFPLATGVSSIALVILLLSQLGSLADRRFSEHIARQAHRFRMLADATQEGVLIHADDEVLDVNEALCRLLGRLVKAVVGHRLREIFGQTDLAPLLLHPPGPSPQHDLGDVVELDLQLPGGRTVPVELRSYGIEHDGRPARVALLRDLRERRAAENHIRHMAHHDALTGLANRFLFNDRLGQAIAQASRNPAVEVAVLCLDLDRFKPVNDLLGHQAGDLLLQQIAARLRSAIREIDTVGRLGGDEFAIIQTGQAQPQAAATLGTRLATLLAEPYDIDGQQVSISASIGIATFPADATTPARLLQQADSALYRAKHEARRSGSPTVRFFEPEMDLRVQRRRRLESDLRVAISGGQMQLHYQPLLRGADGSIAGYEALLRWNHPQLGWISPAELIPLAEETGLISPLGHWVMQTACREAASWESSLNVSVNLSPAQFRQPGLVKSVADVLASTGLAAARLELELTESVLIDNADQALATLHRLKALGVTVALDDFGTGYSSLSYLSRFPFDRIKIDQSFVRDMLDDANARAIVQAIIGLGRTLNRQITAEGVETAAQATFLREQACDLLQGYLLGHPRPATELPGAATAAAMPAPRPHATVLRHGAVLAG